MAVVGRLQQELGRVGRAAGDDDDATAIALGFALALDDDLGHGGAGRVRLERADEGMGQQGDGRILDGRAHGEHLGIRFRVDQAREPVAVLAANAAAERHSLLVEHDAAGCVERAITRARQVVVKPLHARLVRDRRVGIRRAGRRLGRVFPACAVYVVHLLGLGVVGLHLFVREGPGRRDTVVVPNLAEVFPAQAVERSAVHLGGAADEVVDAGLEGLAVPVVPRLRGDVAVLHEDLFGHPVLRLARQPPAALEEQDAFAGRGQVTSQSAAAGAASDDDHVVGGAHADPPFT